MNDFLSQFINFIHVSSTETLVSILAQLFIITGILYGIYNKFIKNTSSERLVKGILILIIAWLCGEILIKFNFYILGTFIRASVSVIAISLIVIFQPELRRFLGYIGQTDFWKKAFFATDKKDNNAKVNVLKELTETVKYLSKTKTGGLIILQTGDNQASLSDVETKIDAKISSELLLTIFFPNTPLHDGAVVIQNERIISAGVVLPTTKDPKLSWRYGTRHRAAIGITEISDCTAIVVSEETGDISIAFDGDLKKYESISDFKADLSRFLKIEDADKKEKLPKKVFDFINFKPNTEKIKK